MSRHLLSAYINNLIIALIYLVAVFIPLFFAPLTTEYFEIPKLIVLSIATFLLLGLWVFSWVVAGRISFTKTPLDLPLILFLGIILLSTFFSDSRYIAIFGNFPRVHGSAISWTAYILFYFIVSSNLKNHNQIKGLYYTLVASGLLVVTITLLSYFKIYLPLSFAQINSFTPTGSPFSTAALMVLLLPFSLVSILSPNKLMPRWLGVILASIFLLVIVLTGNMLVYILTALGVLIILLAQKTSLRDTNKQFARNSSSLGGIEKFAFDQTVSEKTISSLGNSYERSIQSLSVYIKKYLPWIVVVVPAVCLLVAIFSFIPLKQINPLTTYRQDYVNNAQPQQLQLSFPLSWKISASSFRDSPFLGTGPSTYLFNFTSYKPIEINNTNFWNIRFDQAFNEYLQIFGTLGLLGFLALLFLSVMILLSAWKKLPASRTDQEEGGLITSLGLSLFMLILLLIFHASTVVVIGVGLLMAAMFMGINRSGDKEVEELTIGIKTSQLTDSSLVTGDLLPIIVLFPVLIFIIWGMFNGIKAVRAEYYHKQALDAATSNAGQTYIFLQKAELENPWIDTYRIELSQTNFALANGLAASKGPTQSSPSGSLTDQDKANIQILIQQAINEGRNATVLSPRSAQNWEVLASIYRQISGVAQTALQFSLDAYGRAIQRDPLNPLLRLNVGGVYYSIKNYDLAIRFFTDVINLKPDYANGYYNLAVAFRDKGDFANAQAAAEQTISLIDPKSQDYQVATKILANIKARNATSSASQNNLQAPSSQNNGALQQQQLPKVVNLPAPENIATPEAVKKPTPTPSPSP